MQGKSSLAISPRSFRRSISCPSDMESPVVRRESSSGQSRLCIRENLRYQLSACFCKREKRK